MKKIVGFLALLFTMTLVSCSNNDEKLQKEKFEGLFISNYHSSDGEFGEILYLNNDLELINQYDVKGTEKISSNNLNNEIFMYGMYGVNTLNLEDKSIDNVESNGYIMNIHSENWLVDGGYLEKENKYTSKIIDLSNKNEYSYDGAFRNSIIIGNYIFILVEDVFINEFSLIKFNINSTEYEKIDIEYINKEYTNSRYQLISLNNKGYLLEINSSDLYSIENDDSLVYIGRLSNDTEFEGTRVNWSISLDDYNILVCINNKNNLKFFNINIESNSIEEKFIGIGDNISISPKAAINGEYMYLSLTTQKELCIIKKIDLNTEEIIIEKDITPYWKNKAGKYQIADMYYSK